jgi:drug/metabolite transporter (DMT)-like permease
MASDTAAPPRADAAASPPQHGVQRGQWAAFLALVAGALAMGLSPIFVRYANAEVGPFASAFWRVVLALPVLYAWMQWEEGEAPQRRLGSQATGLAGLAFAGDLFFWHLAILNTTVANATFFATTAPLFVVLIVWLVLRQRVGRATLGGLLLCLLGGAALIGQSFAVEPGRIRGDAYGIATAFFFALTIVAIGRARRSGIKAGRATFEMTLVTAAVLLIVALAAEPARFWPKTASGVAALLAMAWISHAGGQGLLAVALGRLPAVFSSLVIFIEAIAAAAFGWLLLGEDVSLVQGLGGALILAGIGVARPRRSAGAVGRDTDSPKTSA